MEAVKDFYTVKEISELAGTLPAAIRAHISKGKLKAAKINGSYIIDREEAERYIAERSGKKKGA